ncbi:hypothetical protein [Chondromyces crocatus]|uniref:EF-hand domain-containing protein n=1 Tax=Chondromyces crocatus TaxID=52 RepID=A0A0K1EB63_CHOCO|nr:hypothetical protein [Chondromyces crocatus]AKT37932.1 uncharacterized protein CMC5_020750 [Chondromyces crocatus]
MKHSFFVLPSLLGALLTVTTLPACDGDDGEDLGPGSSSTTTTTTGPGGPGGGPGGSGGAGGNGGGAQAWELDLLMEGLEEGARQDYVGEGPEDWAGDGGLAHLTYWKMATDSPEFMALSELEKMKVTRLQASALGLASEKYEAKVLGTLDGMADVQVPGTEVTGTLVTVENGVTRKQRVVLKLPTAWNGHLVVAGTPGTRNEFSNDVIFASWLLKQGFAFISGDKGTPNGEASLLEGTHTTQHWGDMLVDLGVWARGRLEAATHQPVQRVLAVGLSNGGFQVRRGMEIDHARVAGGEARVFHGGLDWSGVYWPRAAELDTNGDGTVSPAEFAAGNQLVASLDRAALAMKWAHDPQTVTTPSAFAETPPFSAAHPEMLAAGFTAESSVIWGAYNTLFDAFKSVAPMFEGTGYYNITGYTFRAELMGHTAAQSAGYSAYPSQPGQEPPLYGWLASAVDGGWTPESVDYALRNATTGEISARMMTLHGDRDGFLGLVGHAQAYREAVVAAGNEAHHRLYVIQNGTHTDRHADGKLDYDFDGTAGEEGAGELLTPMQGYVQKAFGHLVTWVTLGAPPPDSGTVSTDPVGDPIDPAEIDF